MSDTGHGKPREIVEKIFHPYFTTKKHGGTGRGIAIESSRVNDGELSFILSHLDFDVKGKIFHTSVPWNLPVATWKNDRGRVFP